jgi:TM2 domain-containing membrane protein YozV
MNELRDGEPGIAARGVASICSLCVPGLGQLIQGRIAAALIFFTTSVVLWCCCLGWIPHAWSVIDAAVWTPARPRA